MKASLTVMKNLINAVPSGKDLYLSIIDEEGNIRSANSSMQKYLELEDPREVPINFFDLLHPVHIDHFRDIIREASERKEQVTAELFLKNRFYHPVKWRVSSLRTNDKGPLFFCIGYSVINHERLKKFSQLLEKYHQLVMEGLTGIIFHDREGELIAANAKTTQVLRTGFEEIYEMCMEELWTSRWCVTDERGEKVPLDQSPFRKAIRESQSYKQLLNFKLPEGESKWILFNSQPLAMNETGGETFVVSSFMDVTSERELSQQLEETTGVMNAFLKQTPNLAWVVGEDTRLVFASSAFCRQFGIDETKCIGKKMSDLVPAQVYESLYEKHIRVLEEGQVLNSTEKIRLADGSNYVSHVNLFPLWAETGKKLIGGYAINMPDTSRLQTDLRQANDRLLSLTQVGSDAIWEWDMQTGRILRNEPLMQLIGFQPDHAKGLSWWLRRIHPEDRNRVSDTIKELTENNQQSWEDEYRFKCADGQYKHVRDKGFVIYENGLPVKMVGCLHDISALKELEYKLADEKLKRQQDISETIIQVQEKERTRIGHELHDNVNQVLSSALLFIEMLKPADADQRQAREKAMEYVTTAIDEIRKLSREMVVPQLKEQGLLDGIRSLVNDINLAGKVKFSFEHDFDPGLLSSAKKTTLFRIVQEQAKNILAHSRARKAEVHLKQAGTAVQLVIRDNGIGFDSRQTHRGIGLSNIYERISFYNGTVDIQTASGKGCTVTVTLPLQKGEY
jgi:PAS domain S-box-containing protein